MLKIPRGRVMTYGSVAAAAGMPGAARTVGYAMHSLGRSVPWQRVLGRKNPRTAQITIRDPRTGAEQRRLLEKEGVKFDARGGVSLADYGFVPKRARQRSGRSAAGEAQRAKRSGRSAAGEARRAKRSGRKSGRREVG